MAAFGRKLPFNSGISVRKPSNSSLGVTVSVAEVRIECRNPILAPFLVVNLAVAPSEEAIPTNVRRDQKQESDDFVADFHTALIYCAHQGLLLLLAFY